MAALNKVFFSSVHTKRPPCRLKKQKKAAISDDLLALVGMTGLEPATSSSRTKRSTRLNYIPLTCIYISQKFFNTSFFYQNFHKH